MKKSLVVVFALAMLASCGKNAGNQEKAIAVSIYPLYDIVHVIVDTNIQVIYAIPAGANPHTYEPTPAAVDSLSKCVAFIGISGEFDAWAMEYLKDETPKYFLTDDSGEISGDPAGNAGHHDEINPHIWLSVREVIRVLPKIVSILSNIDPDRAAIYRANAETYLLTLKKADAEITSLFDSLPNKVIVEWHPSWDYFARDYGIEIAGVVEEGHGEEPSVGQFEELIKTIENKKVKVIVVDSFVESRVVDSLAEETGAEILKLDTLGSPSGEVQPTYVEMILNDARSLSELLKSSARQ